MNSDITYVVLTVLNSFKRQFSLVSTSVTSALEDFINAMRKKYVNLRFTYLPTHSLVLDVILQQHYKRKFCDKHFTILAGKAFR